MRILILGATGAGKSTLAAELGEALGIPVFHLDRSFYLPGWRPRPRNEWEQLVRDIVQEPEWIIDGNYLSTLPIRLAAADTVLLYDVHPLICTWRVFTRRLRFRGREQPYGASGCFEQFDARILQLLIYTMSYRRKMRPRVMLALGEWQGNVWLARNRSDVQQFLSRGLVGVNI